MKDFIVIAIGGSTRITVVVGVENNRPSSPIFSESIYERACFWDTCMAVKNRLQLSEKVIKGEKCFHLYDQSNNNFLDLCSAYKDLSKKKDNLTKIYVNMRVTPFLLIGWLFFDDFSFKNDKNFWQLEHTFEEFVTQSIIPLQTPEFVKVIKKIETSDNKVEVKNEQNVETLKTEVQNMKNEVKNIKYHLQDMKTEIQNMKTVKKNVPFFDNQVIRTEVKAVKKDETEVVQNEVEVAQNEVKAVKKDEIEVVKNEVEVCNVQDDTEAEAKEVPQPIFEDWTTIANQDWTTPNLIEDDDHSNNLKKVQVVFSEPIETTPCVKTTNKIADPVIFYQEADKNVAKQCENIIQKVVNVENYKVIDDVKEELNELFSKVKGIEQLLTRVFGGIVAHA